MGNKNFGFSLTEMLVATLLMAASVSLVAGTLLQGSGQTSRLQRKEQATLQANRLLQGLKNYVTADHSPATANSAPEGCWNSCNPPVNTGSCPPANCPSGWALDNGEHDITFLLPAELKNSPYNGTLKYTVATVDGRPQVTARMDWVEP